MVKKVVLDTNVFVSALKRGSVRKILEAWIDGKFDLVVSDAIVGEIFAVIKRPKFNFSSDEIAELGDLIFEQAVFCSPKKRIRVCFDPDDNKFLECALEAGAGTIVSGDSHLLKIREYEGIKIVSPSDFLRLIEL